MGIDVLGGARLPGARLSVRMRMVVLTAVRVIVLAAVRVLILRAVAVIAAGRMIIVVRQFAGMVTFAGPEESEADDGGENGSPAKNGAHRRESRGP